MRVIEVSMEKRRNERVGETGDHRENPPTSGIVRHDSHRRKSGVTRLGIEPRSTCDAGMKGRGKWENPEKTRRRVASSSTIPTCEGAGATPPGIEPAPRLTSTGRACWSASMGAAGLLPPVKTMTAFRSLVRHLGHVTPGSQSRSTRVSLPGLQTSTE
ncbi:hypothetical protein PR048_030753 [Dryococelus australis]|uniref:Uncharacterized protein n=1 Tax=Dryococelus australis TaxID=614101 RepID=A0ABQ9G9U1_9NEOP|nr:hypothetical protein PR048_030753 [Dryococelus australis]